MPPIKSSPVIATNDKAKTSISSLKIMRCSMPPNTRVSQAFTSRKRERRLDGPFSRFRLVRPNFHLSVGIALFLERIFHLAHFRLLAEGTIAQLQERVEE